MLRFCTRLFGAALVFLAGLVVTTQAQFNPNTQAGPGAMGPPAGFNSNAVAGATVNPYAAGAPAGPYGYYSPWINYNGPVGGALTGASNVISSQGGFAIQQQQAVLEREKIKAARIDNKRRAFDEWMYEREHTPTLEEERERTRMENVQRSLNNPPITEILSGKALNDMLVQLQIKARSGGPGPDVPINPQLLSQVNITGSADNASLGVLRNAGRLDWPSALFDPAFEAARTQIDQLAPRLVSQAARGGVDNAGVSTLSAAVDKLQKQLRANVANVPPDQYITAKRYLNDLDTSIRALRNPNAAKYASGTWTPKGRTVGELVQEMTANGLRFAQATPGDESAYVALQRAMATYSVGMSQMASK
jgi:hypothetical protein